MIINRPNYIEVITPFIGQPLVKILSGIRRCGKSTIFEMLKEELILRGVEEKCIISKRYTDMDIAQNITAKQMYDELVCATKDNAYSYLILDEIQEISGWEKAVNSLLEKGNFDIYVTGSNSKLMSSEISTYLTGRYVQIPVYTLSFSEYLKFKSKSQLSKRELLNKYIRFGGFPVVALNEYESNTAYQIVNGIYYTVVSKFLKSENRQLSNESIYNYLRWLEQAFIIYPCRRYDLQGKNILKTQEKYYLADVSLKYALFGYNRNMLDAVMENIVYLELKRRGYDVYVGKLGSKEIDFVGILRDEKIYVQVCVQLPENSDRETANLKDIPDNYPKYVVTLNDLDVGNDEGIKIVHLQDFLLQD